MSKITDERGNVLYTEDRNGWQKFEYDASDRIVHYVDSDNLEYWKTYWSDGTLRMHRGIDGTEYNSVYDMLGNLVYKKTLDGVEKYYYEDVARLVVPVPNRPPDISEDETGIALLVMYVIIWTLVVILLTHVIVSSGIEDTIKEECRVLYE